MGRVMAIDMGASSYRIIEGLYQDGTFSMKVLKRFKHEPKAENGHLYWDVFEMVENLAPVLQEAAKEGEPVLSIGFDTFGTGFAFLDADGRILDKPLDYRDNILDGTFEYLVSREADIYEKTGGTFETSSISHVLKGMADTGYEPLRHAEHMLCLPDLLAYLFTGCRSNESTIATTSRLLDIRTREWNWDFIRELGVPEKIFHKLEEAGTIVGTLKPEISGGIPNLQNTVVTMVACHDTASALMTVPQMENCSFISSGSWSVKGILSQQACVTLEAFQCKILNEGQPWGTYRLLRNIAGLWLVEECVRNWRKEGQEIPIPELMDEAANAPEFPSMIYTTSPDFTKMGNMPGKIRKYCKKTGQKVPETPQEIAQTIIWGLACEYRRHNEELEAVTGEKIHTIYIVGGGRNNRYLNQCTADMTGCKVITGHPEATALGNLLVQLWAHKEISEISDFVKIADQDVPQEYFEPVKREGMEERYAQYLKLVEMNLEQMQKGSFRGDKEENTEK